MTHLPPAIHSPDAASVSRLDLITHAKRQAALTALGQKALAGIELPELFQAATAMVEQILQLPHSQIWQVLSDGSTVQAMAGSTPQSPDLPQLQDIQQALGWTDQEPFVISVHLPHQRPDWLPTESQSSISFLIPGQTKPLGILCAHAPTVRDFTADDLHFLQAITHLLATALERKRSEALLQTQTRILESIAAGSDLQQVFNSLCLLLEQQSPGVLCSILLLDAEAGRMRAGAAPSLSHEVAAALDGLVIGEGTGSCGTAAYRGEAIFVTNVATDPVWALYRDFAIGHNIHACWSTPFLSQAGEVLGTFALSHCIPCEPTAHHLEMMKTAAHLASIAVEGHRAAAQLKQQALYDALTGLPNRVLFLEQLQQRLHQQNQQNQQQSGFAVLFLDVDQFKLINDSLGHTVGDQMLIEIAQRLQHCLSSQETFARLSGDEFAILLNTVEDTAQAQVLANELQMALSQPLKLKEHEVFASVSIGIAHSSNSYGYAEELLRDADTAMYRAKALGRERYVTFDQTMHTQTVARLQMEIDLHRAVEELAVQHRSQFQLSYQPIISLSNQKIVGFEALIRWQHPERGLVSPLEFIPIAEETGLILPIGRWVLQSACEQMQTWQQMGLGQSLVMSVNVSGSQFLQPNFASQIKEALSLSQIAAANLKLEITESLLMEASPSVIDQFELLQALGIKLSLDDFGTGYSPLSYLYRFPIHTLKIDRSFVQSVGKGQAKLVQTIAALAQGLDMDTVAEGVETPEQLAQMQALGCDYYQGYLFSPPVPAEAATRLLQQAG